MEIKWKFDYKQQIMEINIAKKIYNKYNKLQY